MLDYNMLFRLFLDMNLEERAFDHSTFSVNRTRLIEHDIAKQFFAGVIEQARSQRLLSDEHFTVGWHADRGLGVVQRASSAKTASRRARGEMARAWWTSGARSAPTPRMSRAPTPEAKLMRKGNGQPAKLSFGAHALMENAAAF